MEPKRRRQPTERREPGDWPGATGPRILDGWPRWLAHGAGSVNRLRVADGGAGVDPQRGVLNERPDWSWKIPKPVRT